MRLLISISIILVLLPASAFGFCGFYVAGGDAKLFNDATQTVLMRHNETTILSMQNNYRGPVKDFAMVVPVPEILKKENVKTLKKDVFDRIDRLTAPRLVEYYEQDPCNPQLPGGFGSGRGIGGMDTWESDGAPDTKVEGFVKVKAKFVAGEYDISILETNDATTLEKWLTKRKYKIPEGAAPYFRPYIEAGQYFFVAKVITEKVKFKDGNAVLSPLRFHYKTDTFQLPIRLGMINSAGQQDLLIYTLAQNKRYEVANYPNVFIPTNVDVRPAVKQDFGNFYEALFSATIEENPKAVVTEYAWSATKCDPCPSGAIGSSTLTQADFDLFGADVLNIFSPTGWTVTRLHARFKKEQVGEDLVFKEAKPVVGGREVRPDFKEAALEPVTVDAPVNQFQGRYIVRNEWEGEVKCDNPQRGIWGRPPNIFGMQKLAKKTKEEIRRKAIKEQHGRDATPAELKAPLTEAEQTEIGKKLKSKFGYSIIPGSSETAVSPSRNTTGTTEFAEVSLKDLVAQNIKELSVVATGNVAAKAEDEPKKETTHPKAEDSTPKASSATPSQCATGSANGSFLFLIFALFLSRRRRVSKT